MEKIARCVQTIKGVPICLDVEDIDESDDVANDQGRQYNKDIGPESYVGGGVSAPVVCGQTTGRGASGGTG